MKILIINGPNLDLLGEREKNIYGSESLQDIIEYTEQKCQEFNLDVELTWFQSAIEGEIIQKLHLWRNYDKIIINPAGYSHTSIAIYDALKLIKVPIIEVHLSQIYQREEFRQTMLTAKAATAIMSGFKSKAYFLAILSQKL